MNKNYLLGGGLTLLASFMLAACNSNDDDNAATPTVVQTTQVTVTPSLGKILNAKVTLKNAKTGAELGNGKTDSTGTAKINTKKTTDPVVVEVQGVDGAQGATYFDEAKNADIALPATQKIRAIVPTLTDNANVGVTVLTEVATQAAIKAAGDLSKVTTQVATDANNQIKNLLAKELGTASLLTPPTIIGKDTIVKDVITARNAANDYALKLAAMAKLGQGNTPVLDLLQKLSDDLSDNKLDGMKGTANIDYATGETDDTTVALQNYMAAYANAQKINTIYTAQILNGFQVIEGNIVITIGNGGSGSGSSGGNYNLTVKTDVSGLGSLPIPTVTIQNVPKPDTESAFCNDSEVKGSLPDGAITITGCSFSGNTGTISVQLNQGILLNYTVTYTYTPV